MEWNGTALHECRSRASHMRPVGHAESHRHTHLHTNQARTDYQLGLGTNEGGPLGGLFARFEDPCNAIRFGQHNEITRARGRSER